MTKEKIAEVARALWAESYSSESDFIQAVIDKMQAARAGGEVVAYGWFTANGDFKDTLVTLGEMAEFGLERPPGRDYIAPLYAQPTPAEKVPEGWRLYANDEGVVCLDNSSTGESILVPAYSDRGDLWMRVVGQFLRSMLSAAPTPVVKESLTTDEPTPEGYAVLPKELTAENGAKTLLIGEFFSEVVIPCPDCEGDDGDEDYDCSFCNSSGTVTERIPVSWPTIKNIWRKAVDHFATALQPVGESEPDYKALYHELLHSVETNVPGETRHQTALRYIGNAERGTDRAFLRPAQPPEERQ